MKTRKFYRLLYIPYERYGGISLSELTFEAPNDEIAFAVANPNCGYGSGNYSKEEYQEWLDMLKDEEYVAWMKENGLEDPTDNIARHKFELEMSDDGEDWCFALQELENNTFLYQDSNFSSQTLFIE